MSSLLEVKNLKTYFKVGLNKTAQAVDDVSFEIEKGKTLALVGESGCGKTTVGRAMINILHHVAPDVEIGGEINYQFADEIIDFTKLNPKKMQK